MHRHRRIISAVVLGVVLGVVLAAPASAARWNYETLDGQGGTNGRTTNNVGTYSTSVVWNNQPHVFYGDDSGADLRHAWWNGTTWKFETLDGNGGPNGRTTNTAGPHAVATVWNNTPHVWYLDKIAGDLRHAWWTGSAWFFEVLDGDGGADGRTTDLVGFFNSVAVWNNTPHVFYADMTAGDLRHGWWTGTKWQFETLDGNCPSGPCSANGAIDGDVGQHTAVAVWNNLPHVWYFDNLGNELRHAWWNGTRWQFETLDGVGGSDGRTTNVVGKYVSASVWNNQPHVWYQAGNADDLRHAWWTGAKWQFETLDGNCATVTCADGRIQNEVGFYATVTVWNNQPHVWYSDDTAGELRHNWYG